MSSNFGVRARIVLFGIVLVQSTAGVGSVRADDPVCRTGHSVRVTRARPVCAPTSNSTLGIFRPTPYIMVRGDNPVGGGYSPLGISGDQSMSLYGPLSPLRATTGPVSTYVRGYDGQIRVAEATGFSTPNLPGLSPVIYPTEFNNYYGPRVSRTPPSWSSAINWIDQN